MTLLTFPEASASFGKSSFTCQSSPCKEEKPAKKRSKMVLHQLLIQSSRVAWHLTHVADVLVVEFGRGL